MVYSALMYRGFESESYVYGMVIVEVIGAPAPFVGVMLTDLAVVYVLVAVVVLLASLLNNLGD